MSLKTHGISTSDAEVVQIDAHGFWVNIQEKEYFLPFTDFPWFKNARVSEILELQLLHETHLYWPSLDIDLSLDSLDAPERYPLVAH